MQSPEGGFYSALDADSEGHEGRFYVWNRAEVESLADGRTSTACSRAALASTASPTSRAPGTCTATSRSNRSPTNCSLEPASGHGPARLRPRAAPGRSRAARAARPRRQGAGRLEWTDDPRPRDQRAPARRSGSRRGGDARRRFPAPELLARRPVARGVERWRCALSRLSRRPRIPARRPARTAAGALAQRGSRIRAAISPTRCWRSSWIASAAASGSPRRASIRRCIVRKALPTRRRPRAMASRRWRSQDSAGCWPRPAISMPRRRRCAAASPPCNACRRRIRRC